MKQILRKYKRAGVTDYESTSQAISDYIDKSEEPLKPWQLDMFAGVLDYVAENIERDAHKTRTAAEWRELERQYVVKSDFTITDLVDYLLRRLKKKRITREQLSLERSRFKPCKHRFCLNYYIPHRNNQEFCSRDCKEREKRALKEYEKTSKVFAYGTYLPPSAYKTLRQAELEHLYRKHERKFDPVVLTDIMVEDEIYAGKRDKATEERKNRAWKINEEVEKGVQNHVNCEEMGEMPIKDLAVCNQIIAKEVKVYDSEKFRLIRLYSGMSQRDFAEYIGVSTATIAHIETGNRTVTPMVKSRLAEKFDLTDDFLKYVDRYRRLSQ